MRGKTEQIDHQGDVNHTAANAENAGKKADESTADNAKGFIISEVSRIKGGSRVFFAGGSPV